MTQRTFQLSAERRQLLEKMLRARGVDAKLPARIEPRTEAGPVPLSFAQQRLWFLHQLEPNAAHYHIVRVVRLGGRLDIAALAAALGGVVQRHEALRTVFRSGDGEPQQVTLPPNVALPLIDLSGVSPAAREATAHRLAGDSIGQPFDLSHGPLLRVVLLRLGPTDHIAALAMHHIVSDEWSMGIFIRELATLYEAAGAGQPPNATALPPLEIQYPDFAIWQRRWLRGEVFADRLAYWRQQLAGAPEILELPTDRPRPRVASFRGARRSIAFDAPLAAAIEALGRRHGATQFITLTAAFKALLAQYCQRSDIVIGAVIANRDRAELEPLIGFFVNTLVLRTHLGGDPTFVELIARQRQVAEGAYAHQELPFEKLVDELKPERDPGYNPLFQVAFVFQNAATTQHQLPGLTIRPVAGEAGVARFDLTLVMGPAEDGLTCWMDYRTDLFDATTIARMLVGLRSLLASVAADENLRLSQSPLLGRVERHQLIREWGSCPAASLSGGALLHKRFAARARTEPDATAIIFEHRSFSFQALDRRANRIAARLRALGVGPGELVGLCFGHSAQAVVAILGILKAGNAYVPLAPDLPAGRLAALIADADLRVVLTRRELAPKLSEEVEHVLCLDVPGTFPASTFPAQPGSSPAGDAMDADSPCYVIYTSGSTGRPKGVVATHRGVSHFAGVLAERLSLGAGDRLLLFAPLSFDASALQLFPTLLSGATLVIHPHAGRLSGGEIHDLCRARRLTVLDLPAARWRAWIEEMVATRLEIPETLRTFLTGGENIPLDKLHGWARLVRRPARFYSSYGPTEATITTTLFETSSTEAAALDTPIVPVGRPLPGIRVHLLDRRLRPVPVGAPGELFAGGAGVTRGYLHRPAPTACSFVPDPLAEGAGARLYRTGDLARYLPDGSISFLGRADHQVKVRGFRVEPGEIESALAALPEVNEAAVLLHEGSADDRRLVAYWVPANGEVLATAALRTRLKEQLPPYMIPSTFVSLEALPVLASGKVDRAELLSRPLPAAGLASGSAASPRTDAERQLVEIWQAVIGAEQVAIDDNFFELGGDSILGLQIVARANQAGLGLNPRQIFEHQTIRELAAVAADSSAVRTAQGPLHGPVTLSPIQHWFLEQDFAEPHHFNQSLLLASSRRLDPAVTAHAFEHLLAHHDALRLRLRHRGTTWQQEIVWPSGPRPWLQVDLRALTPAHCRSAIETAAIQLQTSLDLAAGPICRLAHFQTAGTPPDRLLWIIHHLAVDGISWRILLEDFQALHDQLESGTGAALPSKATSFPEWTERLAQHAQGEARAELETWLAQTHDKESRLPLDGLRPTADNTVASTRQVTAALSQEETRVLLQQAPAIFDARIQHVLLAALARVIAEWSNSPSVVIDLEGHGREDLFDDADVSRTVGWFTSQYPVRLEVAPAAALEAELRQVRQALDRLPDNGLSYGLLRYSSDAEGPAAALRTRPSAEVSFNYLGQFDQTLPTTWLGPAAESAGPTRSPRSRRSHLLEVSGAVTGERLRLTWRYSEHRHHRATIERLNDRFLDVLAIVTQHCREAGAETWPGKPFPLAELDRAGRQQVAHLLSAGGWAEPREDVEDLYPGSPLQQGILFNSLLASTPGVYVNLLSCTLHGPLDETAFADAWQRLIDRHPILRTGFLWQGLDQPMQVVRRRVELPFERLDWRELPVAQRQQRFQERLAEEKQQGFDLLSVPLMRLTLIREEAQQYRFMWSFHHLLLDGWSTPLLLGELLALYRASVAGHPLDLPTPPPYRDYIAWLQQQDLDAAKEFWRQQLAGFTDPTPLATQRAEPVGGGFRELISGLATADAEALRALAGRCRVTVNTLVQGAWALLLARYGGLSHVIYGVVVAGRPAEMPAVESMIGLFINTLPAPVQVESRARTIPWLQWQQQRQAEQRQYDYAPLTQIRRWAEMPVDAPLFESIFAFENFPRLEADSAGELELEIRDVRARESTDYPLTLAASLREVLSLRLTFAEDRFESTAAARLLGHLRSLLEAMIETPEARLEALPMLSAAESQQLLRSWQDRPVTGAFDGSLYTRFAAQAQRAPDAIAVVCEGRQLSYRELAGYAERLGGQLRALGVGPEVVVGLCLERSLAMVVGVLGILEAGGAYLPLDPAFPTERLSFMLSDAEASVVVTSQPLAARTGSAPGRQLVCLDAEDLAATLPASQATGRPAAVDPDHLAYVIYTSGSTGKPKGVAVSHRNVTRLFAVTAERFGLSNDDVWSLFHSIAFDFSVWELWGALAYGGRLVVVPEATRRAPEDFLQLLQDEGVSVLNQTPSAFRQLIQAEAEVGANLDLRLVIFGGEALAPPALASWLERHGDHRPRLINMYGITETTVHVTERRIEQRDQVESVSPIGIPLADLCLYTVDPQLRPVPIGVSGELAVAGPGLARGYLGRPGLSAERFVPDPFSTHCGGRLYRSGDLGLRRPDGDLEYGGRRDHQVQIRGFRIELGEIEAALLRHEQVREAVVIERQDRLVAYLTCTAEPPAIEELRRALAERLPEYMVPASFVLLDTLPLTQNNKIDRRALPVPGGERPELEQVFVAPRTAQEQLLAEVWSEVLGVEQIGVKDSFFALGGDSIRSLAVLSAARDRGLALTLEQIVGHPTIEEQAQVLAAAPDGGSVNEEDSATTAPFDLLTAADHERLPPGIEDAYPLSRLQTGMVFHSQYHPDSAVYHDIFSYRLATRLDLATLRAALGELAAAHPILRTSFELSEFSEPLQLVHRQAEIPLLEIDLRALSEAHQATALDTWKRREQRTKIAWQHPPLLRIHLHRLSADELVFAVSIHHAIVDGWSMASMLAELFRRYLARLGKAEPAAPPPTATFRDYVALERQTLATPASRQYWENRLRNAPATRLPRWPEAQRQAQRVHRFEVPVPPSIGEGADRLARALGVPIKSVLLATHLRVLQRLTDQMEVITGLVTNGRPETADGERVLGLFLNTLPLRLELAGGRWRDLVRACFEVETQMLPHRRFPLAELHRELNAQSLFETTFNFVSFHVYEGVSDLEGIEVIGGEVLEEANYPFGVNFGLDPGTTRLSLGLDYDGGELAAEQVANIGGYYVAALEALVRNPEGRYERCDLLSSEERLQVLGADIGPATDGPQRCFHHVFEQRAAAAPDDLALVCGSEYWTYGRLNARANQLARHLRALGLRPQERVAILSSRSPLAILGILAILKARGIYVPLDPTYPPERLATMLSDAQVPLVLSDRHLADGLPDGAPPVLYLDRDQEVFASLDPTDLSAGSRPDDAIYVIYTSGSTGRPKGVVVSHRSLMNFAHAIAEATGLEPRHRFLHFASFSFDASAVQIFPTLARGASLVLEPRITELSSLEILRLCERQMISHLDLPAGLWRQWVDDVATVGVAVPPSLEVFMTGGESVPWEKLRRWAALSERPMHFLSSYGPTEATVTTTLFQTTRELPAAPDLPNIPIGEPLPGVQLLVLDRFLQPAGIGVPGEVYIGGVGVSRGYLGRPGRTARAFVPHPPAGARGGKAGERCYRTGDLARHLPDGSVEFLGRADRQVKVRGFRIEVGDIEAALAHHPQIEEVAVVLHQPAQGSGENQLVAYVVAEAERPPHAGSLRAFVAERLPHFMVPAVFVFVDRMPVTANGKVDLEALPPPEPGPSGSEEEFVAPRTTTEERLVEIWSDVLDAERIGVFDNLFALGGQSLLAVQLIARVQAAFGVEIPLRRLYEQGTVADLAVAVDAALAERSNDDVTTSAAATETLIAETEQRHRPFPLMPVQEVYLSGQSGLYDLGACGSNAYIELEIGGPAEPFLLRFEQALNRVIARHDMLRAILLPDGQQRILDRVPLYRIARFDLRRLAESAQAALAEMQNTLRYRRLTAGHWPHFELVACRLEDSRTRLLIRIAAVLIDGGSRDLVVADLFRLLADPAADLPPLELSYRDCVLAWSAARDSAPYRRARSYWLRQLPTLPPAPELPLARPLTPETASRFVIRSLTPLDVDAWAAFKRHAADAALTPSSAILTAFTEILARWSHRDEFTLGLVGTNPRPAHPQAEQIVGNFNTLHLLTVRAATGSFADCARQIQDHMAANLEHQAFSGLEVLRELNRTRYRSSRAAMPILFNSVIELAQPAGQAGEDATDQEPAPAETQVRQVEANLYAPQILLSPTVFETAGGDLGCKWQAVDELFPPGLMDHMSEAFTALLQCLAGISDAWQQPVDELLPTTTPAVRFAGAPAEAASSEMIAEPASVTADPQLEARIVTIWQELLEVESVAPDDDFFELGGNSLLAALLQTRLRRELRIEQPLARFFERPTVAALVNELARRQTTPPHLAEAR